MKQSFILVVCVCFFCQKVLSIDSTSISKSVDISTLDKTLSLNNSSENRTVSPNSKFIKQSIAPVSLAASSLGILAFPNLKYTIQNQLNWNKTEETILYDDQLRFAPTAVMGLMSIVGIKGKHQLWEEVLLSGTTFILSDFIVFRLKEATKVARPSPSTGKESFPSQHAAQAFLAATLLHKEFGAISPLISIGGYSVATWVGLARIERNRHYITDVLMGSAIGIFSANLSYWIFDLIPKTSTNHIEIQPVLTNLGAEIHFICNL